MNRCFIKNNSIYCFIMINVLNKEEVVQFTKVDIVINNQGKGKVKINTKEVQI